MATSNNLMKPRTGGQILADQLKIQGVTRIFCVPGESFLGLLDGLYEHRDSIQIVTTRHEGGAANMADAHGKITGRPGVCIVTRGPGATNASIGVHTAYQDSTPLILLIGQVGRGMIDREGFQEMDYRRMYGQMAKWVTQINSPERIPEYINQAFHVAMSGRPGPVVLALPEDILHETVTTPDGKPAHRVQAAPSPQAIADLRALLQSAERPLLVIGGPTWNQEAITDITAFAEANRLPVTVSFRSQDCFDNQHSQYIGTMGIAINPKLAKRVRKSDLLLVVGPRLGEMTTSGYTLLDSPVPQQSLIHIHPGAEELGKVFYPTLAINASMPEIAKALRDRPPIKNPERWKTWLEAGRADYLEHIVPTEVPGSLNMGEVISYLNEVLPDDAVLTNGAGNYTAWLHRFYQYKHYRTQVAPTSGAMGYSVPAAVAAKLAAPERVVVSFSGDGCFQMFGQEIATAIQFDAPVVFIVVNNQMLGTIRMHQERHFPNRVIATNLKNPDFVSLARAYGAYGERVENTEDFPQAFERALACGTSALLELVVDPEALTPRHTLTQIRDGY